MGEPKAELKVIRPPDPRDVNQQVPRLAGLKRRAEGINDLSISRRQVIGAAARAAVVARNVGLPGILALSVVKPEVGDTIRKIMHKGVPTVTTSQEKTDTPVSVDKPEVAFHPTLSAYELIKGQTNGNFENLERYGYTWINADEEKTENNLPEIVLLELKPQVLSFGNETGINMWEGVASDAPIADSLSEKDAEAHIPDLKVAVARVLGEESYTKGFSGGQVFARYGFVTGEIDTVTDQIRYNFSLPTQEPLPEGSLPLFTSANFGTVVPLPPDA